MAHELLELCSSLEHSEEIQSRTFYACAKAEVLRAEGDYQGSLAAAAGAAHAREELGAGSYGVKLGLVEEIEAAITADPVRAEALVTQLERLSPGETTPFLRAQAARFRANLASGAGDPDHASAVNMFRELSAPFWLAVTLLEQGEWLAGQARTSEATRVLAEAREIFERLARTPMARATRPGYDHCGDHLRMSNRGLLGQRASRRRLTALVAR